MLSYLIYLLYRAVSIYTGILIVYALLSWFPGAYDSKFGRLLSKICEPYLSLFDRINLTFGGISFNIMFAVIVLNLAANGLVILLRLFIY